MVSVFVWFCIGVMGCLPCASGRQYTVVALSILEAASEAMLSGLHSLWLEERCRC